MNSIRKFLNFGKDMWVEMKLVVTSVVLADFVLSGFACHLIIEPCIYDYESLPNLVLIGCPPVEKICTYFGVIISVTWAAWAGVKVLRSYQ